MTTYYADKVDDLRRLFGSDDIEVAKHAVRVGDQTYEIIDDVIVTLPPDRRPGQAIPSLGGPGEFALEIQRTFGREWQAFDRILPEHRQEFEAYFDLVDLSDLADALACDLGCGMGRHSHFLAPWCRRVVLVDFSEAIFVARRNLADVPGAIFVMADVTDLPFADDCCDLAFSLGVLHHLPVDALDAVRSLRRLSPRLLVYLYYSLDNRPAHFRALLRIVSAVRGCTARIQGEHLRSILTAFFAYGIYAPLVAFGRVAGWVGFDGLVPLADTYMGKSMARIRQDVYDRFFTSIEQRVSRRDIEQLITHFATVKVSDAPPYWHFECVRDPS
jgi:SAM-dependent methyltransferase